MASLTVSNYLGMLQDDPDDETSFQALADVLAEGDPKVVGEQPLRLMEAARARHERHGELQAVAWLIQLEAGISDDDPQFKAALLKELGRIRHEELLDDEGAVAAYRQALELKPGDEEVEVALEEIEQTGEKWRPIADRFIEEASDASDAGLKASMLARAGTLLWQHQKKGRNKAVDKLFREALQADPASTRAARLYCHILRGRGRWKDVADVLKRTADAARNRDEKLNLYVQAARAFARRLEDRDAAAGCYERVLDFAPGHEEALHFLVEFFTEREEWERLVALYEDALRSRQKLESEQGILLQIGMVHWRIRQRPDEAEPYFARLRKIDPAHQGMLDFYRQYFGSLAEGEDGEDAQSRLLTILGDAQRVATGEDDKLRLAVELAEAAAATGATERAIDAWKAVQRLDPAHDRAGAALRALYRQGEKWNALVEVMRGELEALQNAEGDGEELSERRVDLLRELIAIYRDELKLDVMVIGSYQALLEERPNDEEALHNLAQTYESMGRWSDLIQVLTKKADATQDPAAQVDVLMRIARLWIDRFANYNQATKPLEAIIEIEPENRAALSELKTIYTKKRSWKALYDVLSKESQLASDPDARLDMKVELAKLAGDRLHKHGDAIRLWREVLEQDPAADGALASLIKLADREKDWATLTYALELEQGAVTDDKQRIAALQKLGTAYGDHLDDPHKAATAWKRILEIDPKNGRALRTLRESFVASRDWEGLEALYAEQEDWEGLVDVLGSAAERTEDAQLKTDLSFRAAAVYESQLGNPERAFRSYERVLTVDPQNARAARALVPIYETQEKWARLIGLHEILLGTLPPDDVEERLTAYARLRQLSADKVRDERGAFRWATEAYQLAPTDTRVRDALEDTARAAGAQPRLAELYAERIAQEDISASEKKALRRRLAGLSGEIGESGDAITQLQEILEADPTDAQAIEALDSLYRKESRSEDLRRLYVHRLEHAEDSASRYVLLNELAHLEEEVIDDPASAAERYRAVLEIEASDRDALAALDRLALTAERWAELAEILDRRRDLSESAERAKFTLRLGELRRERLADHRGAMEAYASVLASDVGEADQATAVAGLEALVGADESLRVEAGRHLEDAYAKQGAHEKLAQVLRARLEVTEDEDERRALRLRLAELAGYLGDAEGAYRALEAAFLDRPSDPELWDRLGVAAEAAGTQEQLAVAFGAAIEAGDLRDAEVTQLSSRVAEIYDVLLGRPADAEAHHRRVLHHEPGDERAFLALKELYTERERWEDLQALYRNRIAETLDAEAKLELLLQVCFLFEEILDDPDLAIRSYQEVLELEPEHGPSRRSLDRLYRRTERYRDLVALLRQDLDRTEEEHHRLELRFEIGELLELRTDEPGVAVDEYERVLELSPTHIKAQQALERLIDRPEHRPRIAGILEPLYDAQGAWGELARILEVQLEGVSDPSGRLALLSRIAELQETKLHDPDAAFESLSRAVAADPADAPVRADLARVATLRDAHAERAKVLEAAAAASQGNFLESELLLELARVYDDELGDAEAAEKTFLRLIAVDGDNPASVLPAAQALERIHLAKGDHPALARDLRLQVNLELDPEKRASLLARLATLLEETLEDQEGAIAAHRQRLDIDPNDRDALESLQRLYAARGDWQRLIGILQSREHATDDEDQQREFGRRIGEVYETRLEDADNAIVAYNDVLSRFGPDEETLEALARLYESGQMWDDLLEIREMQLERADFDGEALRKFQMAELMRVHTRDAFRAIDLYGEVLRVSPEHEGTIHALEEIIADDTAEGRVEAARVLAPHYETTASHRDLILALEVLGESDDPLERMRSIRRAAEVADVGLEDTEQAFALMASAVRQGAAEEDLRSMLADLERFAEASSKYEAMADVLEQLAPDVLDAELQTEVSMKAARVAQHRLEDGARARRLYARVLETRPDHREALDALDALQLEGGDFEGLRETLRRKTEMAQTPAERIELLERRAALAEGELGDLPAAIDAMEQVLIEDDRRLEAYEQQERLLTKAERYPDLAALYERWLDAGVGAPVDVRHRLATVNFAQLSDAYAAIDQWREALAMNGNHEPSIAALEKLMADEEHRRSAAEILEPVFLARMEWPRVVSALEARLSVTDDAFGRREILQRLGQIHEDYLEDLDGALERYAILFREDPRDRAANETLGRLGRVLEEWETLARIYAGAVEDNGVQDEEFARLASQAAHLYDERVGDLEKAAPLYERVLEFDPTERSAFVALRSVYERAEKQDELLTLLRRRTQVADTETERVELLHTLAEIHEKRGETDEAIEAHREAVQVDPTNERSIEALDWLLTQSRRWHDLADHLRFRIDGVSDGPGSAGAEAEKTRADLEHRLGRLRHERLDDTRGAIDVFEETIQRVPSHGPTTTALEELATNEAHQARITQVLEPIYRANDQWKKLVAILEAQARITDDPMERQRLLGEVGRLHEERGNDGALAFDAWARAFAADPADEVSRGEIDRLAAQLDAWDAHVAAYEAALAVSPDPHVASGLLAAMARVHDEHRGDPRAAIETYERLAEHDPEDSSALDALEALHTMVGDWRGLVEVLRRKVERSYDPQARAELLRQGASVLEELLGDPNAAIELYLRAAEEDPQDEVALESLDRLYSQSSKFPELVSVLRSRIELEQETDGRVELGLRLGTLAETQLSQYPEAIDAFTQVLQAEPAHPAAAASLGRLYEREALWPELLENLKLRASIAEDEAERVTLIHRAGEVQERELDDVFDAIRMYEQALELDRRHEPSVAALIRIGHLEDYRRQAAEILEPLLHVQERWNDLGDLYRLKAEAATDPFDKKAELLRLAEVQENGIHDLPAAFEATSRALAEDPGDESVAENLERLAAATGDFEALADALQHRAQAALDPSVARGLYVRLARVAEERLADEARAVEAFQRALEQVGDDEDLLAALDRLHTNRGAWPALGEILERRVGSAEDPTERASLLMRLGDLRQKQFGDDRGAFAAYQEIIERDPSHEAARDALEGLGKNPELALDVVDVLEAAYRDTGALDRIAGLYSIRIGRAETDGERVRLLQESAALWENELGRPTEALEAVRSAFLLDPRDEGLLTDLERLAGMTGEWETLRGVVEEVVQSDQVDRLLARDLNVRAAGWYRDRLGDAEAAEARLRAAIEDADRSPELHEQLVDLLRTPGREADLVTALREWAEAEDDVYSKKERLREAARLAESALGDAAAAAAAHEAILHADPTDAEALADLMRMREAEGRFDDVVDLLERRIEQEMEPVARLGLRRQQADIFGGPLADPERATRAFEGILDEAPEDPEAIEALQRLYEGSERWEDLRSLLDRRLDFATTDAERIDARVGLARLAERAFGRRDDALSQLREVLEMDPNNAAALDELERLYALEERWNDLLELLERRASDAEASGAGALPILQRMAQLQEEKRSDIQGAIDAHERILAHDPTQRPSLHKLVTLREDSGDWAGAVATLEQMLPHLETAEAVQTCHRIANIAAERLADPAMALSALQRAYELQPSATTRELLRTHHQEHENWAELAMLLDAEVGEASDASEQSALLKRIADLYEHQLQDPSAAADYLERASHLTPDDRDVLLPLCDLYIAAGRQADAVPVLEKIIESFGGRRSKELAQFHHRLGRAVEGMGDEEKALEHYEAAFRVDLTNVAILRDLGRLAHARGDYARAQKTFRALLLQKLDADAGITKADVYFYLGDIAHHDGDDRKAISMLDRALTEEPGHARATALRDQLKG